MNDEPESYEIDAATAASDEHRHGIVISFADGGEERCLVNGPWDSSATTNKKGNPVQPSAAVPQDPIEPQK